ncbi:MAG: hypothetical protein FWE61_03155, partial [Micrococcales bacterium]|nr:hypothetical protein [Micrococcales bacterium]
MTDGWHDPGLAGRQAAALELVASAVGLSAGEQAAAAAAMLDGGAVLGASGDRYEAFCRTFPLPSERRAQAVASHDEALAAQISGWFALRWAAQHTTGPDDNSVAGAVARLVAAMALPLTDLPELVGDHLGGSDPVTGALVVATINALAWHVEPGFGLVLSGQCSHPVVHVALQAMVDTVGERLLGLAGRGIGLRARADLTATEHDGQVSYVSPGVRFMLAEDRIRSLLMGENLYRRSGLALRELYQNAVDACRHRQARLDYLARTTDEPADQWRPAVSFVQGCDDEGQFIECVDNGIGMGLTEIRGAFCQAGVRSADLPEYLAELAD